MTELLWFMYDLAVYPLHIPLVWIALGLFATARFGAVGLVGFYAWLWYVYLKLPPS